MLKEIVCVVLSFVTAMSLSCILTCVTNREAQITLRQFLAYLLRRTLTAGLAFLATGLALGLLRQMLGQLAFCLVVFVFGVLGVNGLLRRCLIASIREQTQPSGKIVKALQHS